MSCSSPTVVVGGVTISTSDFVNAKELLKVSADQGDPTLDEYVENIANGNNTNAATGVQFPAPVITTLPTPSPIPPVQSNDKSPPGGNGTPITCTTWDGNYDFVLSTHFKVRDFTVNAVFPNELIDYLSYTKEMRCCNLQQLANNVAEPMRTKFGVFNINSGIRNKTSTVSGISQHITGQAMDIQFTGWNYERYWENAAWIKDNIQYDQFIFEHSSETGLAWYHLSYNSSGNRAASLSTKVMTMYRNHYDSGLQKHTL